jgi:hypothetical protein
MNSKKVNPFPGLTILLFLDIIGVWLLFDRFSGFEFIRLMSFYFFVVTIGFIAHYIYRIDQKNRFDAYNEQVKSIDADYSTQERVRQEAE